jgi:competence protein ComEC
MVSALFVAQSVGRLADPLTSVVLAATGMALLDPRVLTDVGFQLSVSATLGLVLLAGPLAMPLSWLPKPIPEWTAQTVAAQIATTPVSMVVFKQLSLVAPLANVLVAPLVGFIMAGAFCLALVLPIPFVANVFAFPVWALTTLMLWLVRLLASLPSASVYTGALSLAGAASLALLLVGAGFARLPEAGPVRQWLLLGQRRWAAAGAMLGALALAPVAAQPDGLMHLSVLQAGRGQAVFARSSSGATVLIAGDGVDQRGLASLVGDQLRPWEHDLDLVILLVPEHEALVTETLRRYPARDKLVVEPETRVELDGLRVETEAGGGSRLVYGDVWIPLRGSPEVAAGVRLVLLGDERVRERWPHPALVLSERPRDDAEQVLPGPREAALELLSDGREVWPST